MEMSHIVMIVVPIISAVGVWVGNHISNKPKKEDANLNRVEFIVSNLEKMNERCEGKVKRLAYENKTLREKNRCLEHQLKEKEEGGE